MEHVDILLHPRWIWPGVPPTSLEDHSLAIRDGRIIAVLPTAEARQRYAADRSHELPGHALIPGLVNAHTHAAMTLLRGIADDLPLMEWLQGHIWPAEQRWVGPEFVADGTRLAVAEMLRGGVTCFNDMYFYPDHAAAVASAAGMRAVVGLIVLDFPTVWARDADEYIHKGLAVHDRFRGDPLISTAFAPHAPYSVGDAALERIRILAAEMELPVHMHVHETAAEIENAIAGDGRRPLERLDDLGLLGPGLIAVHATQLEDAEIERLAAARAHVVHCPESNLKLASGFCPVARLLEAGVEVALGTDGAASNNDLDLLGETRTAALLAKAVAGDASALPAPAALHMATLGGARALGLDEETGSLEPGKSADCVALDLAAPETVPNYDLASQIVYAAGRRQVTDVWIAGRHVLNDGRLTTLDEARILDDAIRWQQRIAGG